LKNFCNPGLGDVEARGNFPLREALESEGEGAGFLGGEFGFFEGETEERVDLEVREGLR
jgi:hypothetical protein